ncbi:hypothetical protein CARUB_v10019567mg [Capsella rubella]|uniref:FBD domain-containing protein n=1 Tax=Capsella rubella TaxID=81985 RepID=R0H9S7_9BRAS|nr:hypothetical protein CARUB_v10019567mg [Capsella rubella]
MSVLAKRWRSLWKMVPSLEFDDRVVSDNISKCLLSHQAPFLQSLRLDMDSSYEFYIHLGILVGIAFGLHIFRFPRSFFNSESLETLTLGHYILINVPSPVRLKSLRTLHLDGVRYKDDESVFNLLSSCISLENLVVHRLEQTDVKIFTIAVPSLQRLTLSAENDDEDSVYVINASALKYLEIQGVLADETCLIENTPELLQASLRDRHFTSSDGQIISVFENILRSVTSVKRLSLEISAPSEITFPTGSIFFQLVFLKLYTFEPEWWNVLMLMLDSSPNLQVLKLISMGFPRVDPEAHMKWNKPKRVPECLLLHLETLVWKDYEGKIKDDKEVAKYILRNASHLKKATFSNAYIRPEKRLESLDELKNVAMTSNSCQLVFK